MGLRGGPDLRRPAAASSSAALTWGGPPWRAAAARPEPSGIAATAALFFSLRATVRGKRVDLGADTLAQPRCSRALGRGGAAYPSAAEADAAHGVARRPGGADHVRGIAATHAGVLGRDAVAGAGNDRLERIAPELHVIAAGTDRGSSAQDPSATLGWFGPVPPSRGRGAWAWTREGRKGLGRAPSTAFHSQSMPRSAPSSSTRA